VIAAAAADGSAIGCRQGVVADQIPSLGRKVVERRDLCLAQLLPSLLPSRHSCLPPRSGGRPADPGEGVDQRATLDAEGAADRGLGGPAFEGRRDGGELLRIDGRGAPAPASPSRRGGEPGLHPLLDQRSLELGERPEHVEQELALWRGRVHLLGQRPERDAAGLEVADRGEKVRQRPAEPIQLPDDQAIAGMQEGQCFGQASPVAAAAAGLVLEQVTPVDAGDPVELAARYDAEGADELVFLDITATKEKRSISLDVVKNIGDECYMPFAVEIGRASCRERV